ncbi:MAG: TlpA family protein disulfide reductase [Candidatus Limnocylindria bacterium]
MRRPAPFVVALLAVAACSSPREAPNNEPSAELPSGAASPAAAEASGSTADAVDSLLSTPLTDVRTGESFTLAELAADEPVIVETMAIWCSNCRAQQQEVAHAHGMADFESVSIDVDPNERPDDLAQYAEREGFDWRFAVADAALAIELRERFSPAVLNPPSMPKLVVYPDGTIEPLEFGRLLSAEELARIVTE